MIPFINHNAESFPNPCTETWKDIPSLKGLLQASNVGRIRSVKRTETIKGHQKIKHRTVSTKILAAYKSSKGYLILKFRKKNYKVHRLVGEAFHANSDNLPQINHDNCIKTDNRAINIYWCTGDHNIDHAIEKGKIPPRKINNGYTILLSELK